MEFTRCLISDATDPDPAENGYCCCLTKSGGKTENTRGGCADIYN